MFLESIRYQPHWKECWFIKISTTTHNPTLFRYYFSANGIFLPRLVEEASDEAKMNLRFHGHPHVFNNSRRLLTAVLLWHAEVFHNGWQQHHRKLQSGRPRQLRASQNRNHGYGGQAGATTTATQTQTSRHERFNTFWLLMFFPFPLG